MNISKFLLLISLTILFTASTKAQEWYSFESQQQINDLVDTGDELLMATDAGLVVMNKSTLEKSFFDTNNSNLDENHIQTITRSAAGNTWIGTYGGLLAQFNGQDFEDPIMPEGDFNLNTFELYDLEVAANGDLWVGSSAGVFQRAGNDWTQYDEDVSSDFRAWDLEIDSEGSVFAASIEVYKFADGNWSNVSESIGLQNYLDAEIFTSSSGDMFVAGDLGVVGRFDGQQWQEYEISEFDTDLNGSQIIGFSEDSNGLVFLNTESNGMYQLENDTWTPFSDEQTQGFNDESDYFYIDEEDNRWLNHDTYLSVNKDGEAQSTTISQHTIEGNNINKLHNGKNGKTYFVPGWDRNISVLNTDGSWTIIEQPTSTEQFEYLNDIHVLGDDDIWLASNRGFYHFDGDNWTFNEAVNCNAITSTADGKVYIRATSIYLIDEGVLSEYNADNSPFLIANDISGHGVDAAGNLWVSSYEENSIFKLSTDGQWTSYTSDEYPAINKPQGDLHFDVEGNIWFPTAVFGAIKFDGTDWSNPFTGNVDLITNTTVNAIESDASGKMYFAHHYGITTLKDGEWENLIVEAVPSNFSHDGDIVFDDDGNLWWASSRYGAFAYTTNDLTSVEQQQIEWKNELAIYPNPADTYCQIELEMDVPGNASLFIYNQVGQAVSNYDFGQLSAGTFQEKIDLSQFNQGLYILQVRLNDHFSTQTLIVK